MKVFDKLVRDRIPEIIAANGSAYEVLELEAGEFSQRLDQKLAEECHEYLESREAEELIDMLEVIYAIAGHRGISPDQLERLREEKRMSHGGFERRLLLVRAEEY